MLSAIPNVITTVRIAFTPLFLIFLFSTEPILKIFALIVFLIASVTDAMDGYVARKYKSTTSTGKFLDPLADKILILSAFISFTILGLIPLWMVILIVLRDMFVTGLRLIAKSKSLSMKTKELAKIKTTTQVLFIYFALLYISLSSLETDNVSGFINFIKTNNLLPYSMLIITIFTLITGIEYLISNLSTIKEYFKF